MTNPTQREEMATLKADVRHLTTAVDGMRADLKELVALKNGGTGIVWLMGILWASGIIGGISALWQWAKA